MYSPGLATHWCPTSPPIDPSHPPLLSGKFFIQHNPLPQKGHGPCPLQNADQHSSPSFSNPSVEYSSKNNKGYLLRQFNTFRNINYKLKFIT